MKAANLFSIHNNPSNSGATTDTHLTYYQTVQLAADAKQQKGENYSIFDVKDGEIEGEIQIKRKTGELDFLIDEEEPEEKHSLSVKLKPKYAEHDLQRSMDDDMTENTSQSIQHIERTNHDDLRGIINKVDKKHGGGKEFSFDDNMELISALIDKSKDEEKDVRKKFRIEDKPLTTENTWNKDKKETATKRLLTSIGNRIKQVEETGTLTPQQSKKRPQTTPSSLKNKSVLGRTDDFSHMLTKNATTIEKTKEKGLENLKHDYQQKKMNDIYIDTQKKISDYQKNKNEEIEEMNAEREVVLKENTYLKKILQEKIDEIQSLQTKVKHLNHKVEKTTIREIESQEKLNFFSEYDPIFIELREHFRFDNAKQVISRMNTLEKQQIDSYNQLLEAQQQRNEMERRLEAQTKEIEEKNRKEVDELNNTIKQHEKEIRNLKFSLTEKVQNLKNAEDSKAKYLELRGGLQQIWEKCSSAFSAESVDIENDKVLVAEILHLLNSLNSTMASKHFATFSMIANKIWKQFFSEDYEIKGKPSEIFSRIPDIIQAKEKEIQNKNDIITTLKKQIQEQTDALRKDKRDINVLKTELKGKQNTLKSTQSQLAIKPGNSTLKSLSARAGSAASGLTRPTTAPTTTIETVANNSGDSDTEM